jgi:hypothetical protein
LVWIIFLSPKFVILISSILTGSTSTILNV